MLLRVIGKINAEDRLLLRAAVKYNLPYLMPNRDYENSKITISIVNLKGDDRGTCDFTPGQRKAIIRLHKGLFTKEPSPWARCYEPLHHLMHEIVHVKQYLTGELREHKNGSKYIYKGKTFNAPDDTTDLDAYYSQPLEIEAYGRAQHLVVRFEQEWKRLKDE